MKKFCLTLIAAFAMTASFAQPDTGKTSAKLYSHYLGVQINELIRQVFNFNNTTSTNTNPYLLTYNINNRKGWGLRLGLGYNYQSFTDDDGITRKTTDLNDLRSRLGIEKLFRLSDKWTAGAGMDAVLNHNDDYT